MENTFVSCCLSCLGKFWHSFRNWLLFYLYLSVHVCVVFLTLPVYPWISMSIESDLLQTKTRHGFGVALAFCLMYLFHYVPYYDLNLVSLALGPQVLPGWSAYGNYGCLIVILNIQYLKHC